jgi:uncharacterized ion transporter superfamily protein YfcC
MSLYGDDDEYIEMRRPTPERGSRDPIAKISDSVLLLVISLVVGALAIWLVQFDWVLEQIAGLVLLSAGVLGIIAGVFVYKLLDRGFYPTWAKLTSAIILGFATFVTLSMLVHSHKLIRDYEHYSSDYDDGP